MGTKLTKARRRVLSKLESVGGAGTPSSLGHPRSDIMHVLFMGGLVGIEGATNAWGEPSALHGGMWAITDAGREALREASHDH